MQRNKISKEQVAYLKRGILVAEIAAVDKSLFKVLEEGSNGCGRVQLLKAEVAELACPTPTTVKETNRERNQRSRRRSSSGCGRSH